MTLQDIYDQLAYGPMSNLFVAARKDTDVGIKEFKTVLPHVQLALNSIYTRQYLRQGSLSVSVVPGTVEYTIAPTNKDLLEIEQIKGIYNSETYDIPLDSLDDPASIRRLAYNIFTIPSDTKLAPWLLETSVLTVIYRANHPEIKDYIANTAPSAVPLYLPATHMQALVYHIAATFHETVGMKNEFHAANNYLMKFEAEMQRLLMLGMDVTSIKSNDRLRRNDWP